MSWKEQDDDNLLWRVTLSGGPYDGDFGDTPSTPECLWARICKCGKHTNWYVRPEPGCSRYAFASRSEEQRSAVYVFGDGDGGRVLEEEKELVAA